MEGGRVVASHQTRLDARRLIQGVSLCTPTMLPLLPLPPPLAQDLYTGGGRTFLSSDAAREFRGLIYQQYGEATRQYSSVRQHQ